MSVATILDSKLNQAILAELHLHAVLPALEILSEFSSEAKDLLADWNVSIKLCILGHGPAALLQKREGRLIVDTGRAALKAKADLSLHFLSDAHVNGTFLNTTKFPPVPIGLPSKFLQLSKFQKLTRILEKYLRPNLIDLADETFKQIHLRMLLRVVIGAVSVIGRSDPISIHILNSTPPGSVELHVPEWGPIAWLNWKGNNEIYSGAGRLPAIFGKQVDTKLGFKDLSVVERLVLGTLDGSASVGLGQVSIEGLVPIADSLNVLMERVEYFLPRSV